jgi:hypothetical protein
VLVTNEYVGKRYVMAAYRHGPFWLAPNPMRFCWRRRGLGRTAGAINALTAPTFQIDSIKRLIKLPKKAV